MMYISITNDPMKSRFFPIQKNKKTPAIPMLRVIEKTSLLVLAFNFPYLTLERPKPPMMGRV